MSKIICGILLAVAFIYALYLVITRRNLAKIKDSLESKNGIAIATLIFCAIIIFMIYGRNVTLVPMLQSAWLSLDDDARNGKFKTSLDMAMEKGFIDRDVAHILRLANAEMSHHVTRKTKGNIVVCYITMQPGDISYNSGRKAMEQLVFLNKAKRDGKLDPETIKKIETAIAYELETLKEVEVFYKDDKYFEELRRKYKKNEIKPTEDVKKAAKIIIELEKHRENED